MSVSDRTPALPDVVTRYLTAHHIRDKETALATFHEDATVTDDGSTYTGVTANHHVVTNRLEGDFPGGRVDLRFRFTLRGGLIEDLTIAP